MTESKGSQNERGITPSKIARLYGVSIETFNKWIVESPGFNSEDSDEEVNFLRLRKWTPKQLQKIFDEFGDPREFQDIINE